MKQGKKWMVWAGALVVILLVGWKIKPVELVSDKLLIDLDTAIVEAGWGQEGNPGEDADAPPQEKNPQQGEAQNPEKPDEDVEKKIILMIMKVFPK